MDEAVHKAAKILADANYSYNVWLEFYELRSPTSGCRAGRGDWRNNGQHSGRVPWSSILGIQEVGIPTCTLGQMRHRATLRSFTGAATRGVHIPGIWKGIHGFTEGRFEKSEWKSYPSKGQGVGGGRSLEA